MAVREYTRDDGVRGFRLDYDCQHSRSPGNAGRRCRHREELVGVTKTQATKVLTGRLGEVTLGSFRCEKRETAETFNGFADRFMREYGNLRRSDHYTQNVKPAREFFGERRLREIRRSDLDLYAAERSRKVGPATVRKNLVCVQLMFRLAVRWGVLEASPAVDLQKPSEPEHRTRFLHREEWDRLHAAAEPWLKPILALAICTGLRLKEAVGLRWSDVDRKDGLLYVSEDNKTAKPRSIPLGQAAQAVLDSLKVRHLRSEYVFTNAKGEPYISERDRNRVTQRTKAAAKAAGLAGVTFHTLRHTAGSWAAQAGATEIEIAKLLGHASTSTTRRYTHLNPAHLRGTVRALDAILGAALDTQVDTKGLSPREAGAAVAASSTVAVG